MGFRVFHDAEAVLRGKLFNALYDFSVYSPYCTASRPVPKKKLAASCPLLTVKNPPFQNYDIPQFVACTYFTGFKTYQTLMLPNQMKNRLELKSPPFPFPENV